MRHGHRDQLFYFANLQCRKKYPYILVTKITISTFFKLLIIILMLIFSWDSNSASAMFKYVDIHNSILSCPIIEYQYKLISYSCSYCFYLFFLGLIISRDGSHYDYSGGKREVDYIIFNLSLTYFFLFFIRRWQPRNYLDRCHATVVSFCSPASIYKIFQGKACNFGRFNEMFREAWCKKQ